MPKIEGPTVSLSFENLLFAAAVIIAFFLIAATVRSGIEAVKGLSVRSRVRVLEGEMKEVKARLERGNRKFKAQSDDIGQLLVVNQSMLMHFITGNDHEKLRETNESLTVYMAARATRETEDEK